MDPLMGSVTDMILSAPIPGESSGEGSIGGLIIFISLALGFSFLCSILEAVLLSTTQSYVELLSQEGKRSGFLMQKHKRNVERPISAILTLNTIAHTVGAAGAGAQATAVFGSQFLGVISIILTLLILIVSEIIPKTLGAVYWRQFASFSAYAIEALIWILFPVVWASEKLTSLLRPDDDALTVTRADIEVLVNISAREGSLLEKENRIVRNLLHLNRVRVDAIMTPRTVMMAFPQELTIAEVAQKQADIPYSRIPIYDKNIDDIVGYVLRHDICSQAALDRHTIQLKELKYEVQIVPETISVAEVMDRFIATQEHIFLVADEYGGTAGVITLEDTVESLLGVEIIDESDVVTDLRQLATQRHERRLARREKQTVMQDGSGGKAGT
jgi:CBS domain containing-hemolysin-like protein